MSTKEKLIERFKRIPTDFTFEELLHLFMVLGFTLDNKGATSGSRVRFEKGKDVYNLHRPHPGNIVSRIVLRDVFFFLNNLNLL